jgi:hypothetical protein
VTGGVDAKNAREIWNESRTVTSPGLSLLAAYHIYQEKKKIKIKNQKFKGI